MLLAFSEFCAISLMVDVICSAAVATIPIFVAASSMATATEFILELISSAAAATVLDFPAMFSAPPDICAERLERSAEELFNFSLSLAISLIMFATRVTNVLIQAAILSSSS